MSKQMSESFPAGVLLAISGGLIDAYSYLYRGHIFANAQTGNVLMFSIHLSKGEWMSSLHYALPVIEFLVGLLCQHAFVIFANSVSCYTGDKSAFYLRL